MYHKDTWMYGDSPLGGYSISFPLFIIWPVYKCLLRKYNVYWTKVSNLENIYHKTRLLHHHQSAGQITAGLGASRDASNNLEGMWEQFDNIRNC